MTKPETAEQEVERRWEEWDGLDSFTVQVMMVERERYIAKINNSLFGSEGYFTEPDAPHAIEKMKSTIRELQQEIREAGRGYDLREGFER